LFVVPEPGGCVVGEEEQGLCNFRVVFYEVAVVSCEPEEFADFRDILGREPFPYFFDFDIVHVYRSFLHSYSQEFNGWLFESTFFWFKKEIVF
jgi:hypothetical protein